MTVDQARDAMLAQRRRDRVGVDVHDHLGFARRRTPAAGAEQRRDAAADHVGQRHQPLAVDRILPVRTEALIVDVVGAELVAVHDQRGHAVEVVDDFVREQGRAASLRKAFAEQKVAIAALQVDRRSRGRHVGERCGDTRSERLLHLIVAQPGVEEIADRVQRGSTARRPAHERVECLDEPRPLRREMQVGDEQRRRHRRKAFVRTVLLRFLGALDEDVLLRHVLMHAAVAGGYVFDTIDHVGTRDDTAENTIAPAVGVARAVIEKVIIGDVDEELRRRGVRIVGSRHRDGVTLVLEPVSGFILDRRPGRFWLEVRRKAAALDHEAVDHTVEQRIAEVARAHIVEEVGHGLGRVLLVELERDLAVVGVENDHVLPLQGVATTVADLMKTRSVGTSLGNGPPAEVGALPIFSTTSMPPITLPNTV